MAGTFLEKISYHKREILSRLAIRLLKRFKFEVGFSAESADASAKTRRAKRLNRPWTAYMQCPALTAVMALFSSELNTHLSTF